ncbi:hypothetical protein MMC31_007792 [Peltigera leucophlebia]|nr:hypothetical protein [Peltigera leucophlebia]
MAPLPPASHFSPALQPVPQLLQPRSNNESRNNNQSPLSPSALKEEYVEHRQAEAAFPPDIGDNNIHSSVLQYQLHIDSVIEGLKCVCECCGLFASEKESQIFAIDVCLIRNSVASGLLIISNIDSCGISNNGIRLCLTCRNSLSLGNRLKFGILNSLPCVDCQSYPPALGNFSMAEEAANARVHPVMSILKLRPSGTFNPAAYSGIKGHAVFLLQNLTPLLTLLPSPTLALHDVIRIVWVGRGRSTNLDLRYCILVRKQALFNALTWLYINNPLYQDVVINYKTLLSIPAEFIPKGISSRIVVIENDSSERKGYGADLVENNDENDLHHAIEAAGINESGILSACIYTDVNESRQNPYLKLISAIHNLFDDNDAEHHNDDSRPVISYNFHGDGKPLNDWDNPDFFPITFPTLFSYGDAGHIAPRSIKVSLYAWAKWALSTHSRRFARQPVFIYVVYDVMQRQSASLGYSLLVKTKQ